MSATRGICQECGWVPGAEVRPSAGSVQGSLATLGIGLSSAQLVRLGVAIVAGVIMARVLPFVYPLLSPLLDAVFGKSSATRDSFNSFIMTALTLLTSVVIAFRLVRRRQRS